jgi:tRNA (guanine37-N1)-methyltransferase
MVKGYLDVGILSRAIAEKRIEVETHNLRDFALNRYGQIDDTIFGYGKGMLFRPEPVFQAAEKIKKDHPQSKVIFLTPQGKKLDHKKARQLSREKSLILIAARYEGMDARIVESIVDEEISIGDYVLTGGELPALVLLDTVSRFIEGAIKTESADEESFEKGLLEYDHYTKPLEYNGMKVPEVLRGGDHKKIDEFRLKSGIRKTYFNRPDLLLDYDYPADVKETRNILKIWLRKNKSLRDYLRDIENISKEWKNARRNSKDRRSGC